MTGRKYATVRQSLIGSRSVVNSGLSKNLGTRNLIKVKWGNFDIGVTLTQVAFCWLLIDRTWLALLLILDSLDCTSGTISNSDATFMVAYINIRLLLFGGRGSFAGFQCDKTFVSWSIPFNLAIRNKSFYSGITMCMLVISCHVFNISDCWISV